MLQRYGSETPMGWDTHNNEAIKPCENLKSFICFSSNAKYLQLFSQANLDLGTDPKKKFQHKILLYRGI